jgi:leucyl aminopeptidase
MNEGLHLLYSVGQAAGLVRPDTHDPRYVELNYKGDPEHPEDVILLVGKCITYDTGGLNIKGTGFMEDMHMDMGGASAVLGAMLAIHRMGIKRNVVGVATVAENAIDSLAYKPHAIIRSHKGLTVEIGNTDAEGRLALADALSYGQQRHRPHTVIDLATLTGACVIALGEYSAGLFTNSSALKEGLLSASHARGERLWHMPIFPEHKEELKGASHADLQSTGAGRYGGACTAAAFLEYFVGHSPSVNGRDPKPTTEAAAEVKPAWAHLDIAGPAMYSKARGHMNAGGTGFGVQVVAQYVHDAPRGALPADTPKKY